MRQDDVRGHALGDGHGGGGLRVADERLEHDRFHGELERLGGVGFDESLEELLGDLLPGQPTARRGCGRGEAGLGDGRRGAHGRPGHGARHPGHLDSDGRRVQDDQRLDLRPVEEPAHPRRRPPDRVRLAAPDGPCQVDERGDVGAPAEGRVRDAEGLRPVDGDDGRAGAVGRQLAFEEGRGRVARQAGDVHAVDGHARVDTLAYRPW